MRKILSSLTLILMSSCTFSMGDSAVKIVDQVKDQSDSIYQSCILVLKEGENLRHEVDVTGDIDIFLPVSPYSSGNYDLVVACAGTKETFDVLITQDDIKSVDGKNFGIVVLERST